MLGVTAQAVSKWENETGMPDISQIVPLAGVFGVSTDVIFGLDTTTAGEDVTKILRDAEADKVRGGAASYIKAYDRISEGLRKYPCDQRLLMNGFTLGMSLCMPDSGFTARRGRRRSRHSSGRRTSRSEEAAMPLSCSSGISRRETASLS